MPSILIKGMNLRRQRIEFEAHYQDIRSQITDTNEIGEGFETASSIRPLMVVQAEEPYDTGPPEDPMRVPYKFVGGNWWVVRVSGQVVTPLITAAAKDLLMMHIGNRYRVDEERVVIDVFEVIEMEDCMFEDDPTLVGWREQREGVRVKKVELDAVTTERNNLVSIMFNIARRACTGDGPCKPIVDVPDNYCPPCAARKMVNSFGEIRKKALEDSLA